MLGERASVVPWVERDTTGTYANGRGNVSFRALASLPVTCRYLLRRMRARFRRIELLGSSGVHDFLLAAAPREPYKGRHLFSDREGTRDFMQPLSPYRFCTRASRNVRIPVRSLT